MRVDRMTAADVMFDEPRGQFRSWLIRQGNREDPVGDLARDAAADNCLGQKRTPAAILSHLQAHHYPCEGAIDAFKRALKEWNSLKTNGTQMNGRCVECGRPLTDPLSIAAGHGPTCSRSVLADGASTPKRNTGGHIEHWQPGYSRRYPRTDGRRWCFDGWYSSSVNARGVCQMFVEECYAVDAEVVQRRVHRSYGGGKPYTAYGVQYAAFKPFTEWHAKWFGEFGES